MLPSRGTSCERNWPSCDDSTWATPSASCRLSTLTSGLNSDGSAGRFFAARVYVCHCSDPWGPSQASLAAGASSVTSTDFVGRVVFRTKGVAGGALIGEKSHCSANLRETGEVTRAAASCGES